MQIRPNFISENLKTKICSKCKVEFPLTNFYISKHPDHKQPVASSWCKHCKSIYCTELNIKYPERRAAKSRTPKGRFDGGRSSAKTRGHTWDLTFEQFCFITEKQMCYYCNSELSETGSRLDRKDSNIGYISENVVPCCSSCNEIKGAYITFDEMVILMTRRIELGIANFPKPSPKPTGPRRKKKI